MDDVFDESSLDVMGLNEAKLKGKGLEWFRYVQRG